jgi:hypothetical protein
MRTLQWAKLPPVVVNKNYKNVWIRVGKLAPIQAKFELEEELFCQKTKKVAAKKDDNKKKEPKVVSIQVDLRIRWGRGNRSFLVHMIFQSILCK